MNRLIDYILDRVTMYRLVVYFLLVLLVVAGILGFFGIIAYSPVSIALSTLIFVVACWCTNTFMAEVFEAPTNVESVYITALILTLIVSPITSFTDLPFLIWVGVLSMASKYILAIKKKHLFNPAAIAVVLTGIAGIGSASWWVGTIWLAPIVVVGSYMIIRKLHYEDMVWSFLNTVIFISLVFTLLQGGNMLNTLRQVFFSSSFLFLGGVMLTEPLTLPPTKNLQMVYGALVGLLTVPFVHLGSLYFTPELALVIGNVFAYIVSPKYKLLLRLQEKIQVAPDVIDFIFKPSQKLAFVPGQYMEWTLPHLNSDSRGNRRYFTLASSPTEDTLRLGVKFYEKGSSYKKALLQLDAKTSVVGAQLAGNFTLPKDKSKKLVFIAGGIGITPFRSMIKYLIDSKQKRDIVLFYTNRTKEEIVYHEVFYQAYQELGIPTIYTLTKTDKVPPNWGGKVGRIDAAMITQYVPDFIERTFYISGPYVMITAVEEQLKSLGVKNDHIKKDFFPGLV